MKDIADDCRKVFRDELNKNISERKAQDNTPDIEGYNDYDAMVGEQKERCMNNTPDRGALREKLKQVHQRAYGTIATQAIDADIDLVEQAYKSRVIEAVEGLTPNISGADAVLTESRVIEAINRVKV